MMDAEKRHRMLGRRAMRIVEWACIGVALTGLGLMVQPFAHLLFRVGFCLLFSAGIAYVSTTFWPSGGVTRRQMASTFAWVVAILLAAVAISVVLAPILL